MNGNYKKWKWMSLKESVAKIDDDFNILEIYY